MVPIKKSIESFYYYFTTGKNNNSDSDYLTERIISQMATCAFCTCKCTRTDFNENLIDFHAPSKLLHVDRAFEFIVRV